MTGFSGQFPVVALKHVVSLRHSPINGDQTDRPYVGLESIESWSGCFLGEPTASFYDEPSRAEGTAPTGKVFERNDVLFGKLRPYLAKTWLADFAGRATTEFLVMRPIKIEPRFLQYVLVSRYFVDAADAATFGSRMPRAEWRDIGRVPIPLPDRRVQCAIADHLDRETARIDALIAAKRRLLKLTTERRRALITRAVTYGLNPNVPFGDHRVPWLGKIPAHWSVWRIGHVGRLGNGSTPSRGTARFWTGGTIPWLNSGVVNQHEVLSSAEHVTEAALRECHLPLLDPGTVLIAIIGQGKTRGRATVLSTAATINQNVAFIAPNRDRLDPWFLRWWLFAAYAFLRSMSDDARGPKGVLSCEDLADLRIPLPPLVEQQEIVRYIARENSCLERIRSVATRTVDLLKERRQALIAAAVTGHVDVGQAA